MRAALRIPSGRLAAAFIDLQEEHRYDPRYVVEDFDIVLQNAARLQAAARAAGVPLYHWSYVVDVADPRPFNPVDQDGRAVFSQKGDPLTELCPETAPVSGERLIVKSQTSGLWPGSSTAHELRSRGVEWLLVSGVWTEACVDATVKDAVAEGLRVLFVKDACGSATRAMHQAAALNIANRLYGGAVTDTDGACALIGGHEVQAWQLRGSVPLRYTFAGAASIYEGL